MGDARDLEAAQILLMLDAPSVGPTKLLALLEEYGSADAALRKLYSSASERVREYLDTALIDSYIESISYTYKLNAEFKLWKDEDYPQNLRQWNGRPPILFYRGDLSSLGDRSLALVGRVDPTPLGLDSAHRFARKCVDNGISVVSGLAKGIDAASHNGALTDPSGETYAVVGHGLAHAYPKENSELYKSIPHHGAIVSQFKTEMKAQKWTFPARNEVMCTLALGTVIVEGKPGCGSIIQADFSFKHGRPVFILSRNLKSDDPGWAQELVRRGAHVIERFEQVLEVVEPMTQRSWRASKPQLQTLFDVEGDRRSLPGQSADVPPSPSSAALFDLDGVVIDSRNATAVALARIASRHLGQQVDPKNVLVTGRPHDALARLGVVDAYRVYRAEYDAAFKEATGAVQVFEEVVDGIKALKASGIRVGAITAQPARRANSMVPREVKNLFEEFLCYNDTGKNKEVGIAAALSRFNVPKTRAAYIGDSPTDLEAARRAGVKGVGVLWGFNSEEELRRWPHDVLLAEPHEIASSLLRILSDG
ncbi:HAD-IA family hydrolase [Actinomadura rupiterrae]|uniref:HAD-IA family hydrolase n=1 Tax=Actinomadura rupiterrae TaxID=559627 RepID=UPI0020A3756A|nr:HAD-IA family hydrolase [Actinomadura rupiterrae]MCP2336963.1 DNA protecting protein DprA [Actinomadura rupiterrae]